MKRLLRHIDWHITAVLVLLILWTLVYFTVWMQP